MEHRPRDRSARDESPGIAVSLTGACGAALGALSLAAAVGTATAREQAHDDSLQHVDRLLLELHAAIQSRRGVFDTSRVGQPGPNCDRGAVFLSTAGSLCAEGQGSIQLELIGSEGGQTFTLASGISQSSIIAAINTFTDALGVTANVAAENASRIAIVSFEQGPAAFVQITQETPGVSPLLFESALGGRGLYQVLDTGESDRHGDLTCDGQVNADDLRQILENWGVCPLPPTACAADLDGDGLVSVTDLLALLREWFTDPGPLGA